MATVISKHTKGDECGNKKQISVQDSKHQLWDHNFPPITLKELLGFLFIFLATGRLVGFIVASLVYFR